MLRLVVLLLVLLNAAYYVWSHGLLRPYGWAPADESEPQRLGQQIRPDALTILSAEEVRRLEQQVLASRAQECLQAGWFEGEEIQTLRQALEATLPAGSWRLQTRSEPASWLVYMGKFPNEAARERKRAELAQMKLTPLSIDNPDLEPGLALVRSSTQAQAQTELAALQRRGVRTARVVLERPASEQALLYLPAVDEAIKTRLEELRPVLQQHPLHSCERQMP
jgi:hypothetical protein